MNVALQQPGDLDDFLAWEERQELRYEFDGLRPVAMTGGTLEHDRIQVNVITELSSALRGKPCRVHGNSLKLSRYEQHPLPGRVRHLHPFAARQHGGA
jgi:Uma2 family endonuclease